MRRPISILCISDLHYEDGDMEAINILHRDYLEFVNDKKDSAHNKRWHPDYIVVAGDIVEWINSDYKEPDSSIKQLMKDFGIDAEHVIIVPGNHDKKMPSPVSLEQLKENKQKFMDFCCSECRDYIQKEKEIYDNFQKVFSDRFGNYVDFCDKYFPEKSESEDYNYYPSKRLNQQIKCLSGVKVFRDDSLCFLVINTEWLYVSKDDIELPSVSKKGLDDLTKYQKVYENCQLCTPIIKDTCSKIKKEFPHYTVVTVMHRGFEDLTWGERNVTNELNVDAIRYIQDVSDIVLTGHDHTIHTDPPTLIKNRIQHFKLGSVGRKEPFSSEHIRTGSIIRFIPTENKIELLHLIYKGEGEDRKWHFQLDTTTYPLYSKFDRNGPLPPQASNITLIKAQRKNRADIENAVRFYFEVGDDVKLHIIEANAKTIQKQLDAVKLEESKCNYVVVYFLHDIHYSNNVAKELSSRERIEIEEKVETFKKNHLESILYNKLIINKIVIQVPLFDYNDEKNTCGE